MLISVEQAPKDALATRVVIGDWMDMPVPERYQLSIGDIAEFFGDWAKAGWISLDNVLVEYDDRWIFSDHGRADLPPEDDWRQWRICQPPAA